MKSMHWSCQRSGGQCMFPAQSMIQLDLWTMQALYPCYFKSLKLKLLMDDPQNPNLHYFQEPCQNSHLMLILDLHHLRSEWLELKTDSCFAYNDVCCTCMYVFSFRDERFILSLFVLPCLHCIVCVQSRSFVTSPLHLTRLHVIVFMSSGPKVTC